MLRPYHSGARAHHLAAGCRDRVPWHPSSYRPEIASSMSPIRYSAGL